MMRAHTHTHTHTHTPTLTSSLRPSHEYVHLFGDGSEIPLQKRNLAAYIVSHRICNNNHSV